ncbi:unnamed protein product [Dovyalis caffra]|uniref:Uncharacterized protein n=1 Tax=Dovyalis caffra TaxID=77055 RepID=A0AAV1RD67_9ROSI|nr:unnamed protein product [Dovyalis caffra]
MKAETKLNAIRSGIVVIGALAFGYLTVQIGFKPFLLTAQQQQEQQQTLQREETSMEGEENSKDSDEKNWCEAWDQRRRMAVAQVICYVAYAIRVYHVHYNRECGESATSVENRKRKACEWERQFEGIKEAINDVADVIREGNAVIGKTPECVYSVEQVFEELMRVGTEQPLRYTAYNFLVEDGASGRAFFGFPTDERKDFLLQKMYGPEDP